MELKKTETINSYENTFTVALEEQKFKINSFKETARFPITSEAKLEESKAVMSNVKVFKEGNDGLYNNYYKPITDFVKLNIYDPIKKLKDELKTIEDYHKEQQLNWLKKKRAEEAKKQAEIEAKLQKEEVSLEKAGKTLERAEAKVEAVKGVSIVRTVKVVDFSKIPDKYKLINQTLLNNDVLKVGLKVEGVQVIEEERLSNRY